MATARRPEHDHGRVIDSILTAHANAAEGGAQRTYRLYLEHTQDCADCDDVKCAVAVGLWRAYQEARNSARRTTAGSA